MRDDAEEGVGLEAHKEEKKKKRGTGEGGAVRDGKMQAIMPFYFLKFPRAG